MTKIKLCNFCKTKCNNKECDLTPKIYRGQYVCNTAHDSILDVASVIYFNNKDYCKVKAKVIPSDLQGYDFYGETRHKWYKVKLYNTKSWKRI